MSPHAKIRFHFDWKDHWIPSDDAEKTARDIMHASAGRMMGVSSFFNDLSLYRWLKSSKGCSKVDLVRVICYHSEAFFFGLQSVYRITYANGISREIAAEKHVYACGFHTMGRAPTVSVLELQEDEFLVDVRTCQGEIVDSVTFYTNFGRSVSFGGDGGVPEPERIICSNNNDVVSRVVAFTGTKAGGLERLGFFVEPVNWEAIKNVVLMRKLLELERADSKIVSYSAETTSYFKKGQTNLNAFLTYANDDIFLKTLSYLIYATGSEDFQTPRTLGKDYYDV